MIRLNCFFQAADAAKYKDALRAAVAQGTLRNSGVQEIRSRDRGLRTDEVGTI